MSDELLDIYDDNFQYGSAPIGQKPRKEVHRDGDWHKGFHCWIVRPGQDGRASIVFQRRSAGKGDEGFALDITAAGHLIAGETTQDAIREIKEELGVDVDFRSLLPLGTIIEVAAYSGKVNREFDDVFFLVQDAPIEMYNLQYEEVDGLTELYVADGIELFTGKAVNIPARSIRIVEKDGKLVKDGPFSHQLRISDFGGDERGNYYVKVLVAADLYFKGYRPLYV